MVMPKKVVLRLTDSLGRAMAVPNLLFRVHAFARRKNDFYLQPFATDSHGVANISKRELQAEVAAHYDSGLMDYNDIEECAEDVEISALTNVDIESAIRQRTMVWKRLLKGEVDRWSSIEELLAVYRAASNSHFRAKSIIAKWDGSKPECQYNVVAEPV